MNLKELRISKGLKQESASKIAGVPLRTYKRYENDSKYENTFKYNQILNLIKNSNFSRKTNSPKRVKILVAGIGYVGLSLATLLAVNNEVTIIDLIKEKVDLVNKKKCPFEDKEISKYLSKKSLNLKAEINSDETFKNKDIIIVATPTDFDSQTQTFNIQHVLSVIEQSYRINKKALIVIKSTIPVGFTGEIEKKYPEINIIFSPEFLREGHALFDNLYPSRIIIGVNKINEKVRLFAGLLENAAKNYNKAIYMSSSDAEATKLFSNAYLAMRVAYFNELDTYAKIKGLNTQNIIKGMGRDNRIGDYYNNPSFGYGGYCLPKDSEQLQSSFIDIPNNNLIKAIVKSNQTRKNFIVQDVIIEAIKRSGKPINEITIGIYSLAMKSGSDNARSSASVDIMNALLEQGIRVIVYDKNFDDSVKNLNTFISESDLIIANRYSKELDSQKEKVYTRDLYSKD